MGRGPASPHSRILVNARLHPNTKSFLDSLGEANIGRAIDMVCRIAECKEFWALRAKGTGPTTGVQLSPSQQSSPLAIGRGTPKGLPVPL